MKQRMGIAMIYGAIVLGPVGVSYTSHAQQVQDSSHQAISDKFFEMLQQDQTPEAVESVFSTSPLSKKMPETKSINGKRSLLP